MSNSARNPLSELQQPQAPVARRARRAKIPFGSSKKRRRLVRQETQSNYRTSTDDLEGADLAAYEIEESVDIGIGGDPEGDERGSGEPVEENTQGKLESEKFVPLLRKYHEAKGLLPELSSEEGATEIFELFWTNEVFQSLAKATNGYAKKHRADNPLYGRKWKPVSERELRVFIAILITMGVFHCKSPSDIWKKRGGVQLHVNGLRWKKPISTAMSNNRFFQIKRYLHISPPDTEIISSSDSWWKKLEPLSSQLRDSCLKYYFPSSNVTVDEMMIRFGGRSKHTVRMPKKPITEGYKVFAICDHGFTINWRFHSRIKGIAELSPAYRESIGISTPSVAVVYQLAEQSLPYCYGAKRRQ